MSNYIGYHRNGGNNIKPSAAASSVRPIPFFTKRQSVVKQFFCLLRRVNVFTKRKEWTISCWHQGRRLWWNWKLLQGRFQFNIYYVFVRYRLRKCSHFIIDRIYGSESQTQEARKVVCFDSFGFWQIPESWPHKKAENMSNKRMEWWFPKRKQEKLLATSSRWKSISWIWDRAGPFQSQNSNPTHHDVNNLSWNRA